MPARTALLRDSLAEDAPELDAELRETMRQPRTQSARLDPASADFPRELAAWAEDGVAAAVETLRERTLFRVRPGGLTSEKAVLRDYPRPYRLAAQPETPFLRGSYVWPELAAAWRERGPEALFAALLDFCREAFLRFGRDAGTLRPDALDALPHNAVRTADGLRFFDLNRSRDGGVPKAWFLLRLLQIDCGEYFARAGLAPVPARAWHRRLCAAFGLRPRYRRHLWREAVLRTLSAPASLSPLAPLLVPLHAALRLLRPAPAPAGFAVSIVSPVYNVAPYLRDFLRGVERQDLGFRRNIQLVLVDDGSTDDSGAICDAFARRHPGNVVVLHQANAGQAAARKAGLARATGRVVNFCDPDDILSRNACRKALAMLDAHPETDVAAIPIFFFGGRRGPHPLNGKFAGGARVADLATEWTAAQLSLPASFVRRTALASFGADASLVVAEDAKETMRLLVANPRLALVPEARYLYRKHADSTLSSNRSRREAFLPVLERFTEWALAESVRLHGRPLPFVQHALLYDLSWKFDDSALDSLSPEERTEFRERTLAILRGFDDDVVLRHDRLPPPRKSFLLARKRDAPPRLVADPDTGLPALETPDGVRLPCPVAECTVFRLDAGDGAFRIHAILKTPAFDTLPPAELVARCGDEEVVFARTGVRPDDTLLGRPVTRAFTAAASVPVPAAAPFAVSFAVRFAGFPDVPVAVSWADFAPLTRRIPHSFFACRGTIVRPTRTGFRADRAGPFARLLSELRFDLALLRRPTWGERAIVAFRWARLLLGPFAPKRVWLVTDRPMRADDCGAALFEYLMAHRRELGVRPRFVLSPRSPDWRRMRAIGPVVPFTPVRYRLASLFADWTLSSQFNDSTRFPFQGRQCCVGDLMRGHRFAFLEHGVADKGLAGFCDRARRDMAGIVATSPCERDALLADARLGYSADEIVLTGLPRFDKAEDLREKCVVFMPTWRRQLVRGTDPATLRRTLVDDFETTPYATAIREALSDPRLLAAAERLGYRLQFRPHPEFMASRERFGLPPRIEMLGPETDIRDVFARGALCVTDRSSSAFDFAWLRKPVLYYQPPGDGMEDHFARPWFDCERDGFGPVVRTRDELVRTLVGLMERGCPLDEPYRSRVEAFFPFRDRDNCKRVAEAILAADRRLNGVPSAFRP